VVAESTAVRVAGCLATPCLQFGEKVGRGGKEWSCRREQRGIRKKEREREQVMLAPDVTMFHDGEKLWCKVVRGMQRCRCHGGMGVKGATRVIKE
jgi:hypothetical protein